MAKKMYESPQETKPNVAVQQVGGLDKKAVVESANARSMKRHDTSGDQYADVNTLPESGGESVDKTGVKADGYLVKKNLTHGVTAMYNSLPPGTNIADQEMADIREMPFKDVPVDHHGFDGWKK